jgi:hypothetical protein
MANEAKYVYGSQLTLEDSGGSAAAAAVVAANAASFNSANSSMYPLADFVLKCDFGAAVAATTVDLFRQDLDIDGTGDALDTTASTYEQTYVGSFVIKSGQSASAYYPLANVPLTANCQFWIKNSTAQNLIAGWTLKATPKSFVPGS